MTKLELCSIQSNEKLVKTGEDGTQFEMFYRPEMFRLAPVNAEKTQVVIEMDSQDESFLNVGIVRNGNYIGLYMNLTSFDFLNRSIYENETTIDNMPKQRFIRLKAYSLYYSL